MSLPRVALGALSAVAVLSTVPLSGATYSNETASQGRLGASPDWTAPTVAVSVAAQTVRGTVSIAVSASDAHSSVRDVRVDLRPAGGTTWTALCTDTSSPYACSWDTTTGADGAYEVRAVATDAYGNSATSAVATRTVDNAAPVVRIDEDALPDHLRGTVTIGALASDAGSGVASVRIQRSADGTSWSDLCTDSTAPYSCTWTTSGAGDAFLRAIAVDALGSSATSAAVAVSYDNVLPTATMTSPGSPLAGTVTLTAGATDADSGVASVLIEQRASSTSPWVAVCTDTTAPYSCRWDTTQVADGTTYAFRSTATDVAGNVAVSATTVTSTVDNRTASVSLEDPGAYLRGTVTLLANANAPGGVQSVSVQYAPAGSTSWTTVCVTTTSPYTCSWDTTTVPGGSYDLRAVMVPVTGSTLTSAVLAGRIVDNSVLRGHDVQVANGGTLGRIDTGDTVTLTYTGTVNLDSLASGWTGAARSVTVRVRDGALAGGTSSEDVMDVFTTSTLGTPVALGVVHTRGDYVKGSQTLLMTATMTAQSVQVAGVPATAVVLRVDALASTDTRRSAKGSRTMTWTPSSAARSTSGTAASTSPANETGALDRDF